MTPTASDSGRSRPSLPTNPTVSGITIGNFSPWPGVGARYCVHSSAKILRAASWRADRNLGRAGLAVPAHELGKVAATCVGKALDELLDGRGFPIVPLE